MKALLTALCMLQLTLCTAQLVPCFEAVSQEPQKTEIEVLPDSITAVKTLYYPTGLENKMVTDSIFTINPETEEVAITVVQRNLRLEDCDKAEIEVNADKYYYFRRYDRKCFQVYRIEKLIPLDQSE